MEIFLSIIMGICLSAASGFRIFVPFLIMSVASLAGWVNLGSSAEWLSTYPALITFGAATIVEIGGYYNPWIDNMLDLISTPLALIAGTILTSSLITDINPLLKITLAIICGGGAALNVQFLTVKARALSSFFTTGLGNPIVTTLETVSSIFFSFLSLFIPILAFIILIIFIFVTVKLIKKAGKKMKTRKLLKEKMV